VAERDAIPDEGPVLPELTELKEQVDAARKRRNAKWPFGRSKAS
jgi:hypothetical protein